MCNLGKTKIKMEYEISLRNETSFPMVGIFSHCGMASDGFISLGSILRIYNAPITEDHAWALCYSAVLSLDKAKSFAYSCNQLMLGIDLLKINSQGQLYFDVTPVKDVEEKVKEENAVALFNTEVISKLAATIYQALDFALKEDEERSLGLELEDLLDQMISSDGTNNPISFDKILKACEAYLKEHLSTNASTEEICRHICKDLVNAASEFSKFVRVADYASGALENLNCNNEDTRFHTPHSHGKPHIFEKSRGENFKAVAHLWIQVVREFREGGIHLRMPNESMLLTKKEYKKTPYERLLDDIRTGRHHLRQVPEDNVARSRRGPPSTHDIVMEYIRSKPKLRKVTGSIRNKPTQQVNSNLFDELMNSIRQASVNSHLKSVTRTSKLANT